MESSIQRLILVVALGLPSNAWAQDETSMPEEVVEAGAGDQVDMMGPIGAQVAGGVSLAEIRWHINRRRRALERCFEGRIFNPQVLSGQVVVTFVISPTGAVTGAAISSSTVDDQAVEQCVVQAISLATFPRTADALPLVVVYPVISREYVPVWPQPVVFASPERWTLVDTRQR